jgi:hypothetical protein
VEDEAGVGAGELAGRHGGDTGEGVGRRDLRAREARSRSGARTAKRAEEGERVGSSGLWSLT